MKVLGINGSARKDGNTAIIMNKVFEELNKQGIGTELVQFAGQVIEPCKACFACGEQKNCVHRKDIFRETFDKMMGQMESCLAHLFIQQTFLPVCRHFWNGRQWFVT